MKRAHRHTIMDGRVVTFARDFEERRGAFGATADAVGPYEVSASRNAVVVHRATVRTSTERDELAEALDRAWKEHDYLAAHDGRPDDGWNGDPVEAA